MFEKENDEIVEENTDEIIEDDGLDLDGSHTDEELDEFMDIDADIEEEDVSDDPLENEELDDDDIEDLLSDEDEEEEEGDLLDGHVDDEPIVLDDIDNDTEVFLEMNEHPNYRQWIDKAREELGRPIDEKFAIDIAKNGISASFLMQREIFDLKGFEEHIMDVETKTREDALYIPEDIESEEYADVMEKHFQIPKNIDGYGDDLFEDTSFAEDDDKKDYLKRFADDIGLKTFQLEVLAKEFDRQKEINQSESKAQLASYRREQAQNLKESYGENFEYNRQQANKLLRTPAGVRLLKEFEGEKFLSSGNFMEVLLEKMDSNIQGKGSSNRGITRSLSKLPTQKLQTMNEKLVKSKWNDSKYKNSRDRNERIKYNKVTAKITYLDNLLSNR